MNNSYDIFRINDLIADISVPYDDLSVLTRPSKELDIVNYYFSSVTLGNKELEQLLYEIAGYAMLKTSIMARGFILLGSGRNGKSAYLSALRCLLPNQCAHEHLEDLSGTRAGGKTTLKLLEGCTVDIMEDQVQPRFINTSLITRIISGEPI